jgi:DNA mismatch repair protein MutS
MKSFPDLSYNQNLTPLLDQYFTLKKECPDAILLFRVGDFYEAYGTDGEILSRALDIVLTGKDVRGTRIPMAGVPYHTLENHLRTLLAKGYTVAVSEQLEEASQAKGLIERDIVRFLTPGTILEGSLLAEKEHNFLLAVFPGEKQIGLSWADVSTASWFASAIPMEEERLKHEISKISPKEILLPEGNVFFQNHSFPKGSKISYFPFEKKEMENLSGNFPEEARHACILLFSYLEKIYRGNPPKLSFPVLEESKHYLVLDSITCRNLELFQNLASGGKEGSLLHVLDKTKTPMGGRLLRQWLLYPLLDIAEIKKRQESVAELVLHSSILSILQEKLTLIGDLERLTARVSFQTANARDLLHIKTILNQLPEITQAVSSLKAPFFQEFTSQIPSFSNLAELLNKSLHPDPPLGLKEGGLIQEGFHPQLDALKKELSQALEWIAALEEKEKKATGIKSLKVAYNQVFGYYIEVSKTNLPYVPKHYIRKQTLANAERFITEELKSHETFVLRASEQAKNLEYEIFCTVRAQVKHFEEKLRKAAGLLAKLDVLASFAQTAIEQNFCKPLVDEGEILHIEKGRHPVVEVASQEPFVPNSLFMDGNESRFLLITGPNMAGKSTYLRQSALIVILAQMGSFVPAESARIGIVDRIFTRIGASDDLHRGESTFFVEMRETAEILRKATKKSLVLLDEIGRGTSTFDGLSLAWAVAEDLLGIGAKVLFATHYHEMTSLAKRYLGVKNFTVAVKESGENVIFLRQIIPGCSDKSYGIHVAQLAGIPKHVVERAKEILASLEERELGKKIKGGKKVQLQLFAPLEHPLEKILRDLDLNQLTGLEALNLLAKWKEGSFSQ